MASISVENACEQIQFGTDDKFTDAEENADENKDQYRYNEKGTFDPLGVLPQ